MSLTLRMGTKIITDLASNIQTKNIAQGGYASVTFNVARKLDQALFDTFTDVFTYDPATGEQTGGGRLLEQGRNDDGTWQVTCLGEGLASMQDVTTPVFYVDQNADNWVRKSRTTTRFDVQVGNYPTQTDDEPSLLMTVIEGVTIPASADIVFVNKLPLLCNQLLGSLRFRFTAGITNTNWRIRAQARSADLVTVDDVLDVPWANSFGTPALITVGAGFTDRPVASISWKRISTTSSTTDETYWSTARDIYVRSQIYGRDGTLTTTGYTTAYNYILPHEVLIDWVVRYCPRLNAATGTIDTTSAQIIDQMAYLDGVHGMQLADDVHEREPAFVWQVWEQAADGTWPFDYTPLPTTVRYEASTDDGFKAPSPSTEVYDEVVVTGKTPGGRDVNVLRTQNVPALTAAGFHRRATIPLGSEIWSTTNANAVGDAFLAEHLDTPNAGTLTIAQRIKDNETGRWVKPCGIRSGELIRVRGVRPTTDTLNAAGPDGQTVFRIVSATFDDDTGVATLELDTYELTESRAIADLTRARVRR